MKNGKRISPQYFIDDNCWLGDVESMRSLQNRLRVHIAQLDVEIGRLAYSEMCFNQMNIQYENNSKETPGIAG